MDIRTSPMVLIHASEVAACIGKNPYKSRADMVLVVLKRMDAAAFEQSGLSLQEDLEKALVASARQANPMIDETVDSAYKAGSSKGASEVHDVLQEVESIITNTPSLTKSDRKTILRHCRSEAYKGFGTLREQDAMKGLEDVVGILTKDNKYTKRRVDGSNNVFVGGRVDGFATLPQKDGDTRTSEPVLIEIKTRMKRLFRKVVTYERIQVLTYMFIFKQVNAKMIEKIGIDVMVHDIVNNEEEWLEITSALQLFASDVIHLMR